MMTSAPSPLRLGIAGLGVVGGGLLNLIGAQNGLRLPRPVVVSAVSARSRTRSGGPDISGFRWVDDAVELALSPDVDVLVELIGGSDGPAKRSVEAALRAGKPVVTANKALIAEHGMGLAQLAEANGAHLLFEAAVAGGVPIVRSLRSALAGVRVSRVSGILNGTCNYILSEMLRTGVSYESALGEAQRHGFAEADPFLDVSGMDAAHKVLILAAIAFSAKPDFANVSIEGIERIESMDITLADKFGYRIRLVAEARRVGDDAICRVAPVLVRDLHPLALVSGSLNAVVVEGDPVGRLSFQGPGAGAGPTASAVMGDIARLMEGPATPPFGVSSAGLRGRILPQNALEDRSAFFIGARLADRSGVFAALTEALADAGVSIDKLIQDSAGETGAAPAAILTHPCPRQAVESALARIAEQRVTVDIPRLIRIETRV
jgi:homoserine dehydrogenase